jgi:NNP family nitrate/nitrite transporter-like MFS transporter
VGIATGILGAAGGLGGFFLPTMLGTLKQWAGTYTVGLFVFASLSGLALICLLLAQRRWIGDWIAEHGRVRIIAPKLSAESPNPA